ncbi:MAG: pilus assembly protein [Bryobacterales bacterium]
MRQLAGQKGNSVVEFALIYPVVFVAMGGLFGLGHAFYAYNSLQSAMRSAARYGSLAPYDLPNGTGWKAAVRNMAVYGDPDPGPNARSLVPGLTLANVQASAYVPETEPIMVTVAVTNFEYDFIFTKFNTSQPVVTFPFLGRALIP